MKKVLLIDCYDSFTDILAQSLKMSGLCEVDIRPHDKCKLEDTYLYDAIVLSPGPGLPFEYPNIFRLLQFLKQKAVLGVCMGHQIVGLACGARLKHLDMVHHGQTKELRQLQEDDLFRDVDNGSAIGLYHSWVLTDMPSQLTILAMSEDNNVMMIRHESYPWVGFQFHPESYISEQGRNLLRNWVLSI